MASPVSSNKSSSSKQAFHFVAGLGSGISGAIILQPMDLLKTRVQQSGSRSIRAAIRDVVARRRPLATMNSPGAGGIGGVRDVLAAFWRGTVPSALRTGIGSAVYFTTLNTIRQKAAKFPSLTTTAPTRGGSSSSSSSLPQLSNTANLLSGTTARTFAGFVLMPLTVIKVRYESDLYSYRSMAGAAKDIFYGSNEGGRGGSSGGGGSIKTVAPVRGIRGFFAGYGATAMRDAPTAGLYLLTYEQFKGLGSKAVSRMSSSLPSGEKAMTSTQSATVNFTSGALAGATCSLISNPFDAVKTRIQLKPKGYRNMWQAGRRMVSEEGVRSLYDGLTLRVSRKAMSSALAWMLYEELIRRAETRWSSSSTAANKEKKVGAL